MSTAIHTDKQIHPLVKAKRHAAVLVLKRHFNMVWGWSPGLQLLIAPTLRPQSGTALMQKEEPVSTPVKSVSIFNHLSHDTHCFV